MVSITLNNLLINGSAESALSTEWVVTGTAVRGVTHPWFGAYGFEVTSHISGGASHLTQTVTSVSGHKYYGSAIGLRSGTNGTGLFKVNGSSASNYNTWYARQRESIVVTASSSSITFQMYVWANSGTTLTCYYDGAILIDLTEAFGSGNEPTADEMDAILDNRLSGWFDTGLDTIYVNTDSIDFENLISNGSFESGTTGWTITKDAEVTVDTPETYSPYGTHCLHIYKPGFHTALISQSVSMITGHKYLITAMGYTTYYENDYTHGYVGVTGNVAKFSTSSGRSSVVYTATATGNKSVFIALVLTSGGTYSTNNLYIDGITVIDLTQTFGSGNEPSASDMNSFIDYFGGWWDSGTPNAKHITKSSFYQYAVFGNFENASYSDCWDFDAEDVRNTMEWETMPSAVFRSEDSYYEQVPIQEGVKSIKLKNEYNSSYGSSGVTGIFKLENDVIISALEYGDVIYTSARGKHIVSPDVAGDPAYAHGKISLVGSVSGTKSYAYLPQDRFGRASSKTTMSTDEAIYLQADLFSASNENLLVYGDDYLFMDGAVVLNLTKTFGSPYATNITTGAVDSIIEAFGSYIPSSPQTPYGLDVENIVRSGTTCYFHAPMTWNSVGGVDYYNIYYSTDNSTYTIHGTSSTTSYDATGLIAGDGLVYYFKVSAVSVEGGESQLSDESHETSGRNAPHSVAIGDVVTGRKTDGTGYLYNTITWSATLRAGSVTKYILHRSDDNWATEETADITSGTSGVTWGGTPSGTSIIFTDDGTLFGGLGDVEKDKRYYYKVVCICSCADDNTSVLSASDDCYTLKTPLQPLLTSLDYELRDPVNISGGVWVSGTNTLVINATCAPNSTHGIGSGYIPLCGYKVVISATTAYNDFVGSGSDDPTITYEISYAVFPSMEIGTTYTVKVYGNYKYNNTSATTTTYASDTVATPGEPAPPTFVSDTSATPIVDSNGYLGVTVSCQTGDTTDKIPVNGYKLAISDNGTNYYKCLINTIVDDNTSSSVSGYQYNKSGVETTLFLSHGYYVKIYPQYILNNTWYDGTISNTSKSFDTLSYPDIPLCSYIRSVTGATVGSFPRIIPTMSTTPNAGNVPVNGYRIEMSLDGSTYYYTTQIDADDSGDPFSCNIDYYTSTTRLTTDTMYYMKIYPRFKFNGSNIVYSSETTEVYTYRLSSVPSIFLAGAWMSDTPTIMTVTRNPFNIGYREDGLDSDDITPIYYNIYLGSDSETFDDTPALQVDYIDWNILGVWRDFNDLEMDTTYYATAAVVTCLGEGTKYTTVEVRTYSPPDEPVTTSGVRNGNYFNTPYIKLGWLPARSTSPVNGYHIYRSTNGVKPGTVTYTIANGTSFNDTDILPNTTYYYWIIPYNGLGEYTE